MADTSKPPNACEELLALCLRGESWSPSLLKEALAIDEGRAFLSIVVERLADLFEPRLSEVYTRLFSEVVTQIAPGLTPRLRPNTASKHASTDVSRVYVLSRVTLGADVAVTSVLLDAAKRKYPHAEIFFVGPRKCYELFAADSRIQHFPAPYARTGALKDRLQATSDLWIADGLVLDPDSRLTQLGLLAVCEEKNYLHFPSRSYGADGAERLPDLAARWAREVLQIKQAQPYIKPASSLESPAEITVSLGVGGNASKGLDADFERQLIAALAQTGRSVIIDEGGDEEERQRVHQILIPGVRTHQGSFASFASLIAQSKLYVGYDSSGGHVASACGVPVISIARGFVNAKMAARWRPRGTVLDGNAADLLDQIKQAIS